MSKTNENLHMVDRIACAAMMSIADEMTMKGFVEAKLYDPETGDVHDVRHFKNLITTAGKTATAARLTGNTVLAVSHLAIGSGTTAPAVGQTALVTETARVAVSSGTNAANVATFVATIPAGTGTGTVEEIGLFNANAAGTMYARALTGSIGKPAGLALQFTWTMTLN
jgi:hypothetical protein